MPQLLLNLFNSTYGSFFHRETHDSSLDRAKMGVACHKVGMVVKISRATAYWAHPTFNIFLRLCLCMVIKGGGSSVVD